MTPLLLVLALLAGCSLVGVALLTLVRAETSELRVILTAPAIGTCVTVLAAFVFSEAGAGIASCAVPIGVALLVASIAIVAVRRPRVHPGALGVAIVCVAGLLLAAWPMFSLGFRWFGNGNDDGANYVLSAQDLLQRGILAFDLKGLTQGRDYATVIASLHIAGSRPGSEMLLAFVSRLAGRPPYQMFMPLIFVFNLCTASAVGALAMQFARRWWAAPLAAALVLISPLATYGALQQLLAQVWALGLVAALFALLMRPELHSGAGARVRELVPIGVLATGLVFGYVEIVPTMGLAYVFYVAALAWKRQLGGSALVRLWLPVLAIAVVILNSYFFTEVGFLRGQVTHGLAAAAYPPLFGYILVPSALPGVVGLQTLPPGGGAPHLDLTIVLAALMLVGAFIGSLVSARRGAAAAAVLLAEVVVGFLLALKNSDFGLFKLSMYVQPFLAAAVAVWVAGISKRLLHVVTGILLVALIVAQLPGQRAYVKASRDPEDAPGISAADVIPAFRSLVSKTSTPVVSVTENPVLIKLEATSAIGHVVYFQSRNVFLPFLAEYASEVGGSAHAQAEHLLRFGPWRSRSFDLLTADGTRDSIEEDTSAQSSLRSGRCELVVPSDNEVPFNSYELAPLPDLATMPCDASRDLLAFTSSSLGESFYLPRATKNVSFFQQQPDPFFVGRAIAGFGRYALFQVLGPTPRARLVLELTDTLNHDGSNRLPPAAVVGSTRQALPLQGRGSARVFSAPLTPQMVAGTPYILLDMGVNGRLPTVERRGVQDVYGSSVPTDPRFLTAYVRDVSLVSGAQYESLHPPSALSSFPADLANPDLEYSGLYEDGWMGADAFVRLAGGAAAELVVKGEVPAGAGKHLELLVNGRRVASEAITPGPLNVRVAVPASKVSRRIELRFAREIKLKAPDLRPAAARLTYLGLVAPPRSSR
jgi:hypothetical protein